MLCIKSLVAESIDLPTLIFDEIDTGISGEAARQVGIILKSLAEKRQVICITHQPQIAGKADAHYFVYKSANGESIQDPYTAVESGRAYHRHCKDAERGEADGRGAGECAGDGIIMRARSLLILLLLLLALVADVLSQPVAATDDAAPRPCREVFSFPVRQFCVDHRLYCVCCGIDRADFSGQIEDTVSLIFAKIHSMAYNLLKGKKGIIFGALDERSIAWRTALKLS